MKKLVILCFAILIGLSGKSQLFDLGLRGGVNLHHVKIKDFDEQLESFKSGDREMGFHLGVYSRINLAVMYIQPELLYTFQNGAISYETAPGSEQKELNFEYSRFDVPILIGAKAGPFRFGLGPVASFVISEPDEAFKKSLKDATYGYQIGMGVNLGAKWRLEARYEGAFGQVAESVTIDGDKYYADVRISQFLLGLGYNFL